MDARPPVASLFGAFGVPATVTIPDGPSVATSVVWLTPNPIDQPGSEFYRRDGQKLLAINKTDVPAVPTGTLVVAPETAGGNDVAWRVDGTDVVEQDHLRVFVVRV